MARARRDKYFALAANAVASLARLVVGIGFARLAGAEDYAAYVLLLTVDVVVGTVLNSVWLSPMMTIGPGLPDDQRESFFARALRQQSRAALLVALLVLPFTPFAMARGVPLSAFLGFAAGLFTGGVAAAVFGRWIACFQGRRALVSQIVGFAFPLASLPVAWAFELSLMSFFWWARALGFAVVGAMGWRALRAGVAAPPDAAVARSREMGRHMLVGSVANSACSRTQPFVLGAAAVSTEVALFGAAATLVGPLRMLAVAVSGVLRPRLSLHHGRADRVAYRRTLGAVVGGLAAMGAVCLLSFLVAGSWVGRVVFGAGFEGLAVVLPWAAAYAAVDAITSCQAISIQTTIGARSTTRLRIVTGVLSLALVYPACARFGAAGAFVALLAAESFYLAAAWALERRHEWRRAVDPLPSAPEKAAGEERREVAV